MDLNLIEEAVTNLSQEVKLLQDYISIKFGLDFQQFRKSRLAKSQATRSSTSAPSDSTRSQNRKVKVQLGNEQRNTEESKTPQQSPPNNATSNEGEDYEQMHSTIIKIEDSSVDSFQNQDDEFLPSDLEEENAMGVVLPEGDTQFLDEFSSSSESEYEPFDSTTPRKRGRPRLRKKKKKKSRIPEKRTRNRTEWDDYETFDSFEEARHFVNIEGENKWVSKGKYASSAGDIWSFCCRQTPECPSKRRITMCPDSGKFIVGKTLEHDHRSYNKKRKRGIQNEVQEEIRKLLLTLRGKKHKSKAIMDALRKKELELPTKLQLRNFLQYTSNISKQSQSQSAVMNAAPDNLMQFPEMETNC